MVGGVANGYGCSEATAQKDRLADFELMQNSVEQRSAVFYGKGGGLHGLSRVSVARPIDHEELAADGDTTDEWVELTAATAGVVQADDGFDAGTGVDGSWESLPYDRRGIYQAESLG